MLTTHPTNEQLGYTYRTYRWQVLPPNPNAPLQLNRIVKVETVQWAPLPMPEPGGNALNRPVPAAVPRPPRLVNPNRASKPPAPMPAVSGEELKRLRTEVGLSQREAAKGAGGISRSFVAECECGRRTTGGEAAQRYWQWLQDYHRQHGKEASHLVPVSGS